MKADKKKLEGTVYEIAARSMNDQVGLISYYISCSQIIGLRTYTLPSGNEFPLIERLAQELETEVNSLKYNARADRDLLNTAGKWIGKYKRGADLWTDHYKGDREMNNPVNFLALPEFDGQDAVTYLFNLVSEQWKSFYVKHEDCLVANHYTDYQYLAHPFIPDAQWIGQEGENLNNIYRRRMAVILNAKLSEEKRKVAIQELFTELDGIVNDKLVPWLKKKSSYRWKDYLLQIASVFWFFRHNPTEVEYDGSSKNRTNSICFRLFPEQIVQMLIYSSHSSNKIR